MRRTDLPAVGRVLADAFADDPFYAVLFPDPAQRARILPAYFAHSASDALDLGAAYVARTAERRVAGAALWAPPEAAQWAPPSATGRGTAPATRASHLPDLFGANAFETYTAVMDHLRARRSTSVATPHWYLNLVGVHPSAHGRGIGRALLRPILERADREGSTTALETFAEANLALYARFGFDVLLSANEPRTGLRWWLLTRPPSGTGAVAQDADARSRSAASNARASDSA